MYQKVFGGRYLFQPPPDSRAQLLRLCGQGQLRQESRQGRWMPLIWRDKEVTAPECAASFPRPLSALPAHIWEEL